MKQYTIIDINGKKHIIRAEDVTHVHVENASEIAIKFWDYVNGERACIAFFNLRNVISISEINIEDVEIEEMSDSITPEQIEELIQFSLIGFNCRRYDNHIIYARLMGYTPVEPTCEVHVSPAIVEDRHGCSTCKHKDKKITAEPCMDCWYCNKWEEKKE